jgi:flagellar biosynthesis/type III secretory pathway protein FliH
MSDPIIKKTFDKLKEISAMDEAQQIARARELGMLRVSMELDEARDEGLQKGREEGRDEGLQKGRDEGLQKGREEGAQKAQAAMIRKFMDAGMSLDQIATILKMAKKELEFLLAVDKG